MSKPNEERDIYYIPPNFLASGRLFGGMIRARNAIEACVLVLLTGIPIIKLPMSLTVRIIILCLLPLPLGIFGIIGFEGDSLSEFAINWVRWFIHRRSLYRSDVTIPETARKQKKRIWEQEATKPPEELGIRIKQPRKKRKRPTKTEKQLNKNNRKMVPSHKKQVTYSEDFVPVKDILNGIIETEDGRYIRVLEVEPINFLLRSTSEQKNIVASFASWMKISPIKIQIKVLTKKADIGKHLNTIERDMESESNPKCRELQLDYYRLIQTIGSREAITRRFLVIFEYEAVTNRKPEYSEMSLTQKGFEYVAQRDPEAVSMIYSRVNSSERIYPGWIDKILRLHAIAIGTVMSNAAGAVLLISQKPSLMSPAKRATNAVVPDPNKIYYYAAHELRVAIEEYSPESVSKSSRTIGIIVKGRCCFFLYFTGSTRMYWMKNSEENYAAAVKSLLLARGFGITSIHQIVIGSTMSVAQRLCHGAKPFGNKYFVVSTFFAQCLFLTNNKEGDTLLKLILHDELTMEINRAALSPFHPPRIPTREYDAIETSLDRPVLLNYQCDLLMLSDIHPMPEGFRGSPIMLCFDYQTQVIQRIVGPAIEVRPLESRLDYG